MPAVPATTVPSPNDLSDRAAMGLPDAFVTREPEALLAGHRDLFRLGGDQLADLAEDVTAPFTRRYAAGTLLAIWGDPRISPMAPQMADIPAGTALIGTSAERVREVVREWSGVGVIEPWIAKECPRHVVRLRAFRLMRYPVTNAEFRRFLIDTDGGPRFLPTSWRLGVYPGHAANHPVWTVTPEAADAYAAWLSEVTGRNFRLPAEAEWEYAASGGDGRQYPWGEEFDSNAANTVEAGPLTTTPVGIYPAGRSLFGVDDMAGNVEEYVADDYQPYQGGETVVDDLGTGRYRVARGGSFTRFGDLARCARRHGWFNKPIYAVGFRLAETTEDPRDGTSP